jgi:DNA-binding CsgD family transcriptional regulator
MQEVPPVDMSGVDVRAADSDYWPEYTDYPERSGDLRSATKVSDFYSARQWHNTRPHTDLFRPLGLEHVLMMCLPGELGPAAWPESAIKLAFFRTLGPDFSERDRALLELLRPHLRQAYLDAERRRRGVPRLTERHREVLRLIAAGYTNTQIARSLGISEATVRTHLENIFARLQVSSRAAAVTRAFSDGVAQQAPRRSRADSQP